MTKHRPPLSFDAALARIVGQLPGGYDEAALRTDRTAATVRAWGDPDRTENIPITAALALDLAYREAGGLGAPFHEAFTVQLELANTDRFALPQQLGRLLPEVLKENGDVEIALAMAAQAGAECAQTNAKIVREADEAIAKLNQVRTAVMNRQTGPPAKA